MKSLKVMLVAATIASTNVVLAQEKATSTKPASTTQAVKETPEAHAAKQTARLTSACALNAEQQAQAKEIYLASDEAIQAAHKAAGKDKTKADADKKKLVAERKKKIEAILTPEQKKKYEEANKANNGKGIDNDDK